MKAGIKIGMLKSLSFSSHYEPINLINYTRHVDGLQLGSAEFKAFMKVERLGIKRTAIRF